MVDFVPGLEAYSPRILERLGIAGQYKQHILRQNHDVRLFLRDENLIIDEDVDYMKMMGMSTEVRHRLTTARPPTLVRSIVLIFQLERIVADILFFHFECVNRDMR